MTFMTSLGIVAFGVIFAVTAILYVMEYIPK